MSGKLDQSLDEIMKDRKTTNGPRGGKGRQSTRKAAVKAKAATAAAIAPAGGIQKNARTAKATKGKTATASALLIGDSKISVSNLPDDVTEVLIKDYFAKIIAPVKRVILNYGPNGRSRGSATVIFNTPTAAAKAAEYDGTRVDGKPMRVEVLVGAKAISEKPAAKSLSDRVSNQPKSATKDKTKDKPKGAAAAKGTRNAKKSGRAGRPKPKTKEELDAEMQDYFPTNGGNTNGAAANGDIGMEDEVS